MTDRDDASRYAPDVIEPGIPATSEMPRSMPPGDEDEDETPPLDVAQGVEEWGTTAADELAGEPLEVRLRREEPDRLPGPDDTGFRLSEPGADGGLVDDEADAVGELDPDRGDSLSPEEAAMRVEDEPAGLNYDPDPGYLER